MERRFLSAVGRPIQLEERGTDPPYIVGLASVFYSASDPGTEYELWNSSDMGRCVERIMPGAFDRMLRAGADVAALFNHDANCLLGRTSAGTCKLEKTPAGLRYTITPPDTQAGRDCVASIRRGDLRGSSFSFMPSDPDGQRWIRQGNFCVREIHDCDIYDVGPVTFPAYAASTTGTRAVGGEDEARAAFAAWSLAERKRLAARTQAAVRARCAELGL